MEKGDKKKIMKRCELCKKTFNVWVDGLGSDYENTEDMKKYVENYCPACALIKK